MEIYTSHNDEWLYLTLSGVCLQVSTDLTHGPLDGRVRVQLLKTTPPFAGCPCPMPGARGGAGAEPRAQPGQAQVVAHPPLDHLRNGGDGRVSAEGRGELDMTSLVLQLHQHQRGDAVPLLVSLHATGEGGYGPQHHVSQSGQHQTVHLPQVGQPGGALLGDLVDTLEGEGDVLRDLLHGRGQGRLQALQQVAERKERKKWSLGLLQIQNPIADDSICTVAS